MPYDPSKCQKLLEMTEDLLSWNCALKDPLKE